MKYIITLALMTIANLTHALSYTQEFTEVELQEKIETMMPLKREKFFVTLIVTSPKLDLLEGSDELSIKANIAVQAPGGIKGTGTTTITGSITYNPTQGSFHLLNPKVAYLHIDDIDEQYQPKIKQMVQKAISNAMANFPLYKLKDNDLKQKLAKSVLESVVISNGKLLVNLNLL
jgi:phosphoribosylformylglycinamidine (FGAM) synthase PurS component